MRIASVTLHNWMCFAGQQTINLDNKAYAVIAQRPDDPERSNWSGKTAFLEAMRFALTGWLNKDRGPGAKSWITDGEKEGGVTVVLDDGTTITRHRKRSTTVTLSLPETKHESIQLKGDEAQAAIDRIIGLDANDFPVTCYFQQRQMARFILDEPSERMAYVSAWLRLEALEESEGEMSSKVSALISEIDPLRLRMSVLETEVQRAAPTAEELTDMSAQRIAIEAELTAVRKKYAQFTESQQAQDTIRRFDALVAEGRTLKAEIDAVDTRALEVAYDAAESVLKAVEAEIAVTAEDMRAKRDRGHDFDGKCPVIDSPCPARDHVNACSKERTQLFNVAIKTNQVAKAKLEAAQAAERAARQQLQAQQRRIERIDNIRDQAKRLQPAYIELKKLPPPPDREEIEQEAKEVQQRLQSVVEKETAVKMAIDVVKRHVAEHERIEAQLVGLEKQLAVYREAAAIFGKQGAQRRVAETALAEIEQAANESLAECGIDLKVEIQWAREGSQIAKTCDSCGKPFPTSARIKTCDRCGAARGPNYVNKLEVVLSDRSGAAEDLAGATIQLAASNWLRSDRDSQWSTAFIDEPFGQLDASNRRVFAAHLATLLGSRYSFSQSFVIAHHSSVLDALPGRILIENDGKHSKIRVVS